MELFNKRLLYLLRLSKVSSFSTAAKALGITQAALSIAIKSLEEDLGTSIIVRSARGIQPTEAGERLLDFLAAEKERLEREVHLILNQEYRKILKIGASPIDFAKFLLPALKTRNQNELTVACFTRPSTELYRAVEDSRLDCAFVGWPTEPKGSLDYMRVRTQIGAIVGTKKHFPDLVKATSRKDLEKYPFIIYPREPEPMWDKLLDYHKGGFVVRETEVLKDLLLSGQGIADLEIDLLDASELACLVRAPLKDDMPDPASYLVYRKNTLPNVLEMIEGITKDFIRNVKSVERKRGNKWSLTFD